MNILEVLIEDLRNVARATLAAANLSVTQSLSMMNGEQ